MYFLFRFHHVLPHEYMAMSLDKKRILRAFADHEIDDMGKEASGE